MIIFVEDKTLKKVIQFFLKRKNKEFPARIPSEGGGWNTVIKTVLTLNKSSINAIGILDGDIANDVFRITEQEGIKNKIFCTKKEK